MSQYGKVEPKSSDGGDGTIPRGLPLVGSTTSGTGVAIQCYERTSELAYGSFALED